MRINLLLQDLEMHAFVGELLGDLAAVQGGAGEAGARARGVRRTGATRYLPEPL